MTPALLDTLTGHVGPVAALASAVVDDRPVAVTGGEDRTVRVWDLISRQSVGVPTQSQVREIWAAATATLNGEPVVITGGRDGTVRMWEATSARPTGTPMIGHSGAVWTVAMAIMAGRPVAASGGEDGVVRLWDITTSRPMGRPLIGAGAPAELGPASTIAGTSCDHDMVQWCRLRLRLVLELAGLVISVVVTSGTHGHVPPGERVSPAAMPSAPTAHDLPEGEYETHPVPTSSVIVTGGGPRRDATVTPPTIAAAVTMQTPVVNPRN